MTARRPSIEEVPCSAPALVPVSKGKHLRLQKFTAEIWVRTDIRDDHIIRSTIEAGHDQFFCPEGIFQRERVCKIRRIREAKKK